jgi:hypothetical protein
MIKHFNNADGRSTRPFSAARSRAPSVPVTERPALRASSTSSRSSISTRSASRLSASRIASRSPRSSQASYAPRDRAPILQRRSRARSHEPSKIRLAHSGFQNRVGVEVVQLRASVLSKLQAPRLRAKNRTDLSQALIMRRRVRPECPVFTCAIYKILPDHSPGRGLQDPISPAARSNRR